jgi:DNA-binding transcriptional MerR regulator
MSLTTADKGDLTIQQMARQSGLSEHTLRYYERIGIIVPVPCDGSSGHRRYPTETVPRIESLACLRGAGMSIEDIRTYLTLLDQGQSAAALQKQMFSRYVRKLECERSRLDTRIKYLMGSRAVRHQSDHSRTRRIQHGLERQFVGSRCRKPGLRAAARSAALLGIVDQAR